MASKTSAKVCQKQWTDESMVSAMMAVSTGKVSINAAAVQSSAPHKTLDDCIKVAQSGDHCPHI